MAVYAIGDIQGCFDSLKRLLDETGFDPAEDRIWFTGDLVNRGPKSLETLRFARDLGEHAVAVLGNHDIHLLAVWRGHAPRKRNDSLTPILTADDGDELLDWLRRRPLLHRGPEAPGHVLVHAGIPPCWNLAEAEAAAREVEQALAADDVDRFLGELYGDTPDAWSPTLTGNDRLRFITNAFTRMRFCDSTGRLRLAFKGSPAEAPADHHPWFDLPRREPIEQTIIMGHWSTLGLVDRPDVLAIDTGCLWGGHLTAVRLDDHHVVSLPCAPTLEPGPGR